MISCYVICHQLFFNFFSIDEVSKEQRIGFHFLFFKKDFILFSTDINPIFKNHCVNNLKPLLRNGNKNFHCQTRRNIFTRSVIIRYNINGGPRPSIFELELPLSDIYFNHSNYRFELRKSIFFFSTDVTQGKF